MTNMTLLTNILRQESSHIDQPFSAEYQGRGELPHLLSLLSPGKDSQYVLVQHVQHLPAVDDGVLHLAADPVHDASHPTSSVLHFKGLIESVCSADLAPV